ncbi:histidine-rich glycoprotein-like [Thrips palmi]|uniref:Histidine-rich glycoprotein-like n=1 Tax=Thrips palmi TaxID=161013 RepID=A0A6P8ZT98_THRPL|nr:histidine-rich glycoprotein-like [Thrips palmi]
MECDWPTGRLGRANYKETDRRSDKSCKCGSCPQLALLVVLAALVGTSIGGSGKGGRKIIIHVPYYVKNHHHTHTVFKYMKGKDHAEGDTETVGDGGHGDPSHAEDLGHHDEGAGLATQDSPQALGLRGHHGHGGHGGGGDNRADIRGHNRGRLYRHRSQQQQRVRESDSHLHREERTRHHHHNNNNSNNNHHHHGHHDDDGREHAHFHTKFTVGENDGQVHETDSSESSELSGHGFLEPHREPIPPIIPREHDYHNKYEVTDHESFERRPISEERHPVENFDEEERHHGNHPHYDGYNALQTELRPDESQHHPSPAFEKERSPSYDRYRNEKFDDKFVPRESRGPRKHKGKRFDEKARRQKYEVEEPNQESSPSRETFSSHENPPDYEPIRRRKHNYNWR